MGIRAFHDDDVTILACASLETSTAGPSPGPARLLLDDYDAGAFQQGDWEAFPMLGSAASFRSFLSGLREKAWCIHIEPPFGSKMETIMLGSKGVETRPLYHKGSGKNETALPR